MTRSSPINPSTFPERHLGLGGDDQQRILKILGKKDLSAFLEDVVPSSILDKSSPEDMLPPSCCETQALEELRLISLQNIINRSLIGLGYYGTSIPAVIQRNILENPSWYTAYTPYQSEIAQGRLEALFNFQTLISELTGLPISNASLLDEATAAAEAMSLSYSRRKRIASNVFLIDRQVLPQTLAVLRTRAEPLGICLELADLDKSELKEEMFGVLIQLPGTNGNLWDPTALILRAHQKELVVTASIDPLLQVLLKPVGDLGVDIAVGSAQRFGVPIGFGGPHAAFFATKEEFKRQVPGRLVGLSVDVNGDPALRLALQTREQHIRRDKATSNICTAQVLLAVLASFYAIHHGPDGLFQIAFRILFYREKLKLHLKDLGYDLSSEIGFDTIEAYCEQATDIHHAALLEGFNLRILPYGDNIDSAKGFAVSLDELTNDQELNKLIKVFYKVSNKPFTHTAQPSNQINKLLPNIPLREKSWLQQSVFHNYRTETELLRYIQRLANKDFSLVNGMIPLGSCTMKLNAASELMPVSWKEFSSIHPFSPVDQVKGYERLIKDLESWLASLTGFSGVSLQPNAGSQGEFAGLLVIRAMHKSRGEDNRNVCLIPTSAHGTNPASAVMAGLKVVAVACDSYGNVDFEDLILKAKENSQKLAALMVTYPSTHGVFEPKIREICQEIHKYGGQVYMDGANLNAQVGLCRPGSYGVDVCHLNLHKTFCIPHGGGGPGVGPIAVASHLVPYLPKHPLYKCGGSEAIESVSAAPFGSAGILPISWMYLRMMGPKGLRTASSIAMLSANYIAHRLNPYYPVLFKGLKGFVAHECILDLRPIKRSTGIEVEDIAKRLMDYGFHAPTVSWPVAGTLMVEPTESESFEEINRFCDAMIAIHGEIKAIEIGESDSKNNPLKCAPHTLSTVTKDLWNRPYSRHQAAFPMPGQKQNKFWPAVSRIDNAYGDRNLVCSCTSFNDFLD